MPSGHGGGGGETKHAATLHKVAVSIGSTRRQGCQLGVQSAQLTLLQYKAIVACAVKSGWTTASYVGLPVVPGNPASCSAAPLPLVYLPREVLMQVVASIARDTSGLCSRSFSIRLSWGG